MGGGREKNRKSREGSFPEDLSEGGKGLSGEEKDGPCCSLCPGEHIPAVRTVQRPLGGALAGRDGGTTWQAGLLSATVSSDFLIRTKGSITGFSQDVLRFAM